MLIEYWLVLGQHGLWTGRRSARGVPTYVTKRTTRDNRTNTICGAPAFGPPPSTPLKDYGSL